MNQYINFYIDNVINTFRLYNDSLFNVSIQGLGRFAKKELSNIGCSLVMLFCAISVLILVHTGSVKPAK